MAGKVSILVCDDDPVVQVLLSEFLGASGFEVQVAGTGPEAYRYAPGITLALVDYQLAGESGVDLVAELQRRWPQVKTILLTAQPEAGAEATRRGVSPDGFITKPFQPPHLLKVISQLLERSNPPESQPPTE